MNGNWGLWTDVTLCSKSCGGGTLSSKRSCDNPAPQNGGKSCPGGETGDDITVERPCNINDCPGILGNNVCLRNLKIIHFLEPFFFLVAGEDPTSDMSNDVELVATFPRPTCPKPPNFPIEKPLGLIGALQDNIPLVCGSMTEAKFCYEFDLKGLSWINQSFEMDEPRTQSAGAQLNGDLWIILGGQVYINGAPLILDTSTVLHNGHFAAGPILPMALSGHCSVSISDSQIFVSGGKDRQLSNSRLAFMLSLSCGFCKVNIDKLSTWKNLTAMSLGRYGHACGKVKNLKEAQVIVAGGLRVDKVEIFTNEGWIGGPKLERQVFSAATVQGDLTFLIVGGMELEPDCSAENCRLAAIHTYNPMEGTWGEKEQVLRHGRKKLLAVPLPVDADCSSMKLFLIN